jgi:hypothetical protein
VSRTRSGRTAYISVVGHTIEKPGGKFADYHCRCEKKVYEGATWPTDVRDAHQAHLYRLQETQDLLRIIRKILGEES